MRRTAALGAGLAAVWMTGCATPAPAVDHRQIERQLVASINEQKPGVTAVATCPGGIRAAMGKTFTCRLRLGTDDVTYTVTISDVSGATYGADTRPTNPVLDTSVIATAVRQQAGADSEGANVDCGSHRFVQLAVGGTLTCAVTRSGQSSTVSATVTDAGGDVSFAAGQAGVAPGTVVEPPPGSGPSTTTTIPASGHPSLPGD